MQFFLYAPASSSPTSPFCDKPACGCCYTHRIHKPHSRLSYTWPSDMLPHYPKHTQMPSQNPNDYPTYNESSRSNYVYGHIWQEIYFLFSIPEIADQPRQAYSQSSHSIVLCFSATSVLHRNSALLLSVHGLLSGMSD